MVERVVKQKSGECVPCLDAAGQVKSLGFSFLIPKLMGRTGRFNDVFANEAMRFSVGFESSESSF